MTAFEPAIKCKKNGICTSLCKSDCRTDEKLRPEEMVKYGWPLEMAKEKQALPLKEPS